MQEAQALIRLSTGESADNPPKLETPITEIISRESKAWKDVLGADVDIKPLPTYITPEVIEKFKELHLLLRYIPGLDLGTINDLRKTEVEKYLYMLEKRYPNWKTDQSLSGKEKNDPNIIRNLNQEYWAAVRSGHNLIPFPEMHGVWVAVQENPMRRQDNTRLTDIPNAIDQVKEELLRASGLSADKSAPLLRDSEDGQNVDVFSRSDLLTHEVRLLEALEWNLLANREGWGEELELTNTKYTDPTSNTELPILTGGSSEKGGAANLIWANPLSTANKVDFRVAIILRS